MKPRLLIIEDEPGLVRTLVDRLEREGFEVCSASDGEEGSLRLRRESFDLLLLDLMLPGRNGLEICRELRSRGSTMRVLMLTARGAVDDRVVGLETGADDYLAKPFEMRELVARVRALLRRSAPSPPDGEIPSTVRFGECLFDLSERRLLRDGDPIELSARECQLLGYLVERRGVVLSRREILRDVWGYEGRTPTRTVDVHVGLLRKKIEANAKTPRHLVTVQGEGYRFVAG